MSAENFKDKVGLGDGYESRLNTETERILRTNPKLAANKDMQWAKDQARMEAVNSLSRETQQRIGNVAGKK